MNDNKKNWALGTKAVQGGWDPQNGEPRVAPIVQSTTYKYDDVASVAKLFDLEEEGHMYSRISNPSCEVLENKIAMMEGGVGALATSSGQMANTIAILNIAGAGDHILASGTLYGGTITLFNNTFKKLGIEVTLVDPTMPLKKLKTYVKENTKAIFAETIANPALRILDFEKFSALASFAKVPFIVDNTFATPYLCRPIEHGADIVMHSTTKYLDGHATSLGGMIVDAGTFNFTQGKFSEFTLPDPSYHGVVYCKAFPDNPYIVKARVQWMRDIGSYMSPMNAFLTNLGMETLHLRMDRHCENALTLAQYLKNNPKVSWVNYPGLDDHIDADLATKYLDGASGVLTFGVKGGKDAGEKLMNTLQLAKIVVHVADVRTAVLHPASMTHRQLTDKELVKAGVSPDLIRVTVGIEDIGDIISDFYKALDRL